MWLAPAHFAMLMNARVDVSCPLTFYLPRWTHAEKVPMEYHFPRVLESTSSHN